MHSLPELPDERRRALRVGDAERDDALAALREHAARGRIDLTELDERSDTALRARTLGELEDLLGDLPRIVRPPSAPRRRRLSRSLRLHLAQIALLDGVALGIWALSGHGSFWPAWVFVLDLLLLLPRRVGARAGSGHPRHYDASPPEAPSE